MAVTAVPREKWPSRVFPTDTPLGRFPCILERLRGAPVRASAKVAGVPDSILRDRVDGTWSILENIGHLIDLEALHLGRLDDFEAGLTTLRAADMENRATWAANHNSKDTPSVLEAFRISREHFLRRLESWEPARMEARALHPRLKVRMRVIDLAFFVAEHDDYHLARVEELLRCFTTPGSV